MGLTPMLKYKLFRKLKKPDEDRITILLVEQNANLINQGVSFLFHRVY